MVLLTLYVGKATAPGVWSYTKHSAEHQFRDIPRTSGLRCAVGFCCKGPIFFPRLIERVFTAATTPVDPIELVLHSMIVCRRTERDQAA